MSPSSFSKAHALYKGHASAGKGCAAMLRGNPFQQPCQPITSSCQMPPFSPHPTAASTALCLNENLSPALWDIRGLTPTREPLDLSRDHGRSPYCCMPETFSVNVGHVLHRKFYCSIAEELTLIFQDDESHIKCLLSSDLCKPLKVAILSINTDTTSVAMQYKVRLITCWSWKTPQDLGKQLYNGWLGCITPWG